MELAKKIVLNRDWFVPVSLLAMGESWLFAQLIISFTEEGQMGEVIWIMSRLRAGLGIYSKHQDDLDAWVKDLLFLGFCGQ